MIYDFDPSGEDHPDYCDCPCCNQDQEDVEKGIEQALEMLENMHLYGSIDKPRKETEE